MNLVLMSLGGSFVNEVEKFKTIKAAEKFCEDMGSRWAFYPYQIIIDDCKSFAPRIKKIMFSEKLNKIFRNKQLIEFQEFVGQCMYNMMSNEKYVLFLEQQAKD